MSSYNITLDKNNSIDFSFDVAWDIGNVSKIEVDGTAWSSGDIPRMNVVEAKDFQHGILDDQPMDKKQFPLLKCESCLLLFVNNDLIEIESQDWIDIFENANDYDITLNLPYPSEYFLINATVSNIISHTEIFGVPVESEILLDATVTESSSTWSKIVPSFSAGVFITVKKDGIRQIKISSLPYYDD